MKQYVLIKELLPVGTTFKDPASAKTERYGKHYEVIIGIGKDHTATLVVDAEAVENNPEYFEEVPDGQES